MSAIIFFLDRVCIWLSSLYSAWTIPIPYWTKSKGSPWFPYTANVDPGKEQLTAQMLGPSSSHQISCLYFWILTSTQPSLGFGDLYVCLHLFTHTPIPSLSPIQSRKIPIKMQWKHSSSEVRPDRAYSYFVHMFSSNAFCSLNRLFFSGKKCLLHQDS